MFNNPNFNASDEYDSDENNEALELDPTIDPMLDGMGKFDENTNTLDVESVGLSKRSRPITAKKRKRTTTASNRKP